ncbi:hypothetical protein EYF80_031901 [Liparis tanakae]|uniref:Uncharacterized protein n=1 Tax=Liparis tanakae TaxID=230148 RepID=A0A4Z2GZ18_9TELE|nr:hypothetical protein EYF80_031901 [Liparis tanakae]
MEGDVGRWSASSFCLTGPVTTETEPRGERTLAGAERMKDGAPKSAIYHKSQGEKKNLRQLDEWESTVEVRNPEGGDGEGRVPGGRKPRHATNPPPASAHCGPCGAAPGSPACMNVRTRL